MICILAHPGHKARLGIGLFFFPRKGRLRRKEQRATTKQEKAFEVSGYLLLPPPELRRGKRGDGPACPFLRPCSFCPCQQCWRLKVMLFWPVTPLLRHRDGPHRLWDVWLSSGTAGGKREVKTQLPSSSRREIGQKQSNVA